MILPIFSWKANDSFFVIGPGSPFPMTLRSTLRTRITSAAVPVKKAFVCAIDIEQSEFFFVDFHTQLFDQHHHCSARYSVQYSYMNRRYLDNSLLGDK